jgi:hypothetical protein
LLEGEFKHLVDGNDHLSLWIGHRTASSETTN